MHQIADLQNRLDSAYKVLTEDLDKQKYLNELQQIQNEFPDLVKKEFLSRQDKRTFLEFGIYSRPYTGRAGNCRFLDGELWGTMVWHKKLPI